MLRKFKVFLSYFNIKNKVSTLFYKKYIFTLNCDVFNNKNKPFYIFEKNTENERQVFK